MKMELNPTTVGALAAAGASFAAAALFRFAMVGYATLGMMFFGIGLAVVLYLVLPPAFQTALTVILSLGVLLFAVAEFPVIRAAGGDRGADADYLIVLGAGVNGSVPSLSMRNRLETALAYLEAHPRCVAVVTGGQGKGEDISEAEAMFRWLRERGIPEERIIREDRATSTWENMSYSFALIPDAGVASVAVTSNEYHLYRARLMAGALGYQVSTVPAVTARPLLMVNYFIREALCVVHFWLLGK